MRFQHYKGLLSRFCPKFAHFYRMSGHALGVLRGHTATRVSQIQISMTNADTNASDSSYHHQLSSMYGKSDINHIMILQQHLSKHEHGNCGVWVHNGRHRLHKQRM